MTIAYHRIVDGLLTDLQKVIAKWNGYKIDGQRLSLSYNIIIPSDREHKLELVGQWACIAATKRHYQGLSGKAIDEAQNIFNEILDGLGFNPEAFRLFKVDSDYSRTKLTAWLRDINTDTHIKYVWGDEEHIGCEVPHKYNG